MNKMTKGVIATGVGIVLLVGGGGTLATWNQSANANAGTVVAGNLDLQVVPDTAAWTNQVGPIDISEYKVVPGDTLTYTQKVKVALEGDLMVANLTATNATGTGDFGTNASVSATTLTNSNGAVLPGTELKTADSGEVTASTTFTFNKSTGDVDAVKASLDLGNVRYTLNQKAPTGTNEK